MSVVGSGVNPTADFRRCRGCRAFSKDHRMPQPPARLAWSRVQLPEWYGPAMRPNLVRRALSYRRDTRLLRENQIGKQEVSPETQCPASP